MAQGRIRIRPKHRDEPDLDQLALAFLAGIDEHTAASLDPAASPAVIESTPSQTPVDGGDGDVE